MSTNIVIPDNLWDEDTEAVITTWLAADGEAVEAGALIAEVMTEKIQYEIESPAAGKLSISAEVDAIVNKGDTIGTIE